MSSDKTPEVSETPEEHVTPEAPTVPEPPTDISADYVNEPVEAALASLLEAPNYDRLAHFLTTLREGHLFVDVTGTVTASKKKGPRIRTTRSTKGQMLLPLFTSMAELRRAVQSGGRSVGEPKGALTPAPDALAMIRSDRFVAVQLNPGPKELVVLRKYIEKVLGDEEITPELLEGLK